MAVIKSCRHGFDLDPQGKDTWQFMDAGSNGVAMLAPERLAVLQRIPTEIRVMDLARDFFPGIDIVFVEGGKSQSGYQKIEIWKDGIRPEISANPEEVIAVVSNQKLTLDKPFFLWDQISPLCDFLLQNLNQEG